MFRGNREQNDPEDDFDIFGADDNLDSVSLDSFLDDDSFLSAGEEKPARKASRSRRVRAVRRVSFIGGCLQVILIALLSLVIFLALGFGIALGARSFGLVAAPATATAEPPTPFPTSTPVPPTEIAAVAVEPTSEPTCAEMADWWNAQATIYANFDGLSINNPPAQIAPLVQRMRIWRDNAAAIPAAPCAEFARGVLLNAYDFLISAFESLNSGDSNAANSWSLIALDALSDLYPALWNANVETEELPVAAGVAGGSGFDCGASAWYDAAKQQRSAFREAYQGLDLRTQPPNVIRQTLNTMSAVRANVDALETPECAATLERLMLDMMSSTIESVQQGLSGNAAASAEALLDARRAELMLNSWIQWMGFLP